MEQDNRHIPKGAGQAHNEQTKPANTRDTDKLRENPHNDERVIAQGEQTPPGSNPDLRSGSTFARKDEEGRNQVTNEQEQNQVVNPAGKQWEDKAGDNEDPTTPEEDPTTPRKNPYEEIGDDPGEMKKKIPKM